MRIKKDTILKTSILSATQHLSNEEFGILIRNIMIEDDKNYYRYENLQGVFLDIFKQKENQWKEDLEKTFLTNPTIIAAFNQVYGQASTSRKAFEELKRKLDEKDNTVDNISGNNTDNGEIPAEDKYDDEYGEEKIYFKNTKHPMVIRYTYENYPNIFAQEDVEEIKGLYGVNDEIIKRLIVQGNIENWKRHYEEILNDILSKQKK